MPRSFIGAILRPAYTLADRLHLNFFRIHVLWFLINPIFWSIIFYVSSGEYPVSYIDALFLCTSAHTVTGLSTMNLSTLTAFQQAILFYLMCVGNYTIVSLVMVIVRKHYFVDKVLKSHSHQPSRSLGGLGHVIRSRTMAILGTNLTTTESKQGHEGKQPGATTELETLQASSSNRNTEQINENGVRALGDPKGGGDLAVPAFPGTVEHGTADHSESDHSSAPKPQSESITSDSTGVGLRLAPTLSPKISPNILATGNLYRTESPSGINDHTAPRTAFHPSTPGQVNFALPLSKTITRRSGLSKAPPLSRQPTIGQPVTAIVTPSPGPLREGTGLFFSSGPTWTSRIGVSDDANAREEPRNNPSQQPSPAPLEPLGPFDPQLEASPSYERRFGGFPGPLTLGSRLAQQIAPAQYAKLKRKLTIDSAAVYAPAAESPPQAEAISAIEKARVEPGNTSLRRRRDATLVQAPEDVSVPPSPFRPPLAPPYMQSAHQNAPVPPHLRFERPSFSGSDTGILADIGVEVKKTVHYLKDGILKVGRNSAFLNTDELTDEQLEELGGIEYRALKALTWIVGLYLFGTQFTMFIIFVIYLYTRSDYDSVFENQPRLVSKAWFSAFQAVSSYTGGGLTLVDQGMGPFAAAYVMVIFQAWLIVAGSLGLPIFLRLIVWILCKIAPAEHKAPLQFLLDHPRRCYLYMFPSHQTWFLVVVFFSLTFVEWFGFLILDTGIPAIMAIPLNIRVLSGLFQSVAVRSSGFAIVPLQLVAPAVQFLYMVMMYIAAYPVAMSVRSTNVYEQRSLGVYEDIEDRADNLDPDVDETAAKRVRGPKGEILFSKYLGMHIRRQLSYDLWWLALALFLIMITERGAVMDQSIAWFNQFTVMFELVSAYATIGLSLGIPTQNYSLSGAFRPLSKFIVCLVMLRGRHRDLPQAIDRAILLPHEFTRIQIDPEGHHIIDEPSVDPQTTPMTSDRAEQPVAEKKEE